MGEMGWGLGCTAVDVDGEFAGCLGDTHCDGKLRGYFTHEEKTVVFCLMYSKIVR